MATEIRKSGAPIERRNRGEEVLKAAIQIFYDKGYASSSIQDVAASVGVLKGSLYHYIDSKEDLLARIFEGSDEDSVELMNRVRAIDAPAVERLREFARLWSLWYLNNLERASLYFNQWKHLTGERLERIVAKRHEYEQWVAGMIDEVKSQGDADPDLDTRYACFFILSAINGLPVWYRRGRGDSAEHISEVYADIIVAMVCGTPGRKRQPKAKPPASKPERK
jgi:AcrR family transcriptional regulator